VSYKQEQRFHLELGLLKMVHAQRLLPLEQLLSSVNLTDAGAAGAASPAQRPSSPPQRGVGGQTGGIRPAPPTFTSRPPGVPPMGGSSPFGQPPSKPSPLEADKARRAREERDETPRGETTRDADASTVKPLPALASRPAALSGQPMPQAFGSPPASAMSSPFDNGGALAVAPEPESAVATAPETQASIQSAELDINAIRQSVLQAMESGGSQMLVHALEEGEWSGSGNTVSVLVGMSEAMIGVSYTREQERLACQAASSAAGRSMKVRLVGGTPAPADPKASTARAASGENIRTRAADEPVVKRMMEKFGAEIRIVMDRSER